MNLKKPKFWDKENPNIYAYFLYPLSLIIQLLRFLKRFKKKQKLKIKTICVGNIYLGGTGKTSLSIKIYQILKKNNIKSCFVKKFYKNQIDEQKLLQQHGKLFLSSNRLEAIKQAEKENYEVIILDDGLQDETIEYDKNFVCFNSINWMGNKMTIPSGPLRERIDNLKNYSEIFINGNLENIEKLKNEIVKINSRANIHIGKYEILNLDEFEQGEKYLVFSGIGNHKTFISMIKNHGFNISKDIEFSDHYQYTTYDLQEILNEAKKLNCKIITTEKDYLRIENKNKNKIKFIKINLKILDEDKFIKTVL